MDKSRSYRYKLNLSAYEPTDVAYRVNDDTATGEQFHFHDGLEIIQTWSDGGFILVEDSVYPMKKGSLYIFNAQNIHCTAPADNCQYVRNKLTFSPLFMSGILKGIDKLFLLDVFSAHNRKNSHCIHPSEENIQRLDELFCKIDLECRQKHANYAVLVQAHLLEMLALIHREVSRKKPTPFSISPTHYHIQNVLDYINSHLTEEISFHAMCLEIHFSKYHMCHLFKNATGMTISQYIISRRISEAKKLLLTGKSISEIALETGFSSFSLFSRTFKKITGITPRAFRKINGMSAE